MVTGTRSTSTLFAFADRKSVLGAYPNTRMIVNADPFLGAMRHNGFNIYYDPFSVNNIDFEWMPVQRGNGVQLYNYYGASPTVSYWMMFNPGSGQAYLTANTTNQSPNLWYFSCRPMPAANTWANLNSPSYSPSGGINGASYVTLANASVQGYIMRRPAWCNVITNGGFSIAIAMNFYNNGSPGSGERIFEFGNGYFGEGFSLQRHGTTRGIFYNQNSNGVSWNATVGTIINENTWQTFGFRYWTGNTTMQSYSGTPSTLVSSISPPLLSIGNTYGMCTLGIPSANKQNNPYPTLNANIAGFVLFDRALSDSDMANAMNFVSGLGGILPSSPVSYFNPAVNS
jgi:hypothetical protein